MGKETIELVREIIKKELISYLIDLRFGVGLILCMFFFISGAYVASQWYVKRLQEYHDALKEEKSRIEGKRSYCWYVEYKSTIYFPPNPLGVFVKGVESISWNKFEASPKKPLYEGWIYAGKIGSSRSLPEIDLSMIVGLFLSLWAMLLTYDEISGEREKGTLKLLIANGCSRRLILFGKYISILIVLLIPLIIGFLSGLIVIYLYPKIELKGADFGIVGIILIISALYLGFWAGMGLFVSSWTKRSSTAMMLFTLIWSIEVIVIPGLISSFVNSYFQVPKEPDIGEYWLKIGEYKRQVEKYLDKIGIPGGYDGLNRWIADHKKDWRIGNSLDMPTLYDVKSSSGLDTLLDYYRYSELLWMNHYVDRLRKRAYPYTEKLRRRIRTTWLLYQLSPIGLYYQGISALAGTSWKTMFYRLEDVRQYQEELRRWIEEEGLRTYKWFTDMFGRVELEDVPSFHRFSPEFLRDLRDAMPQILIIFGLVLAVLSGCLYSFDRYDVR